MVLVAASTATPTGAPPTAMVAVTVSVASEMTLTRPAPLFATYTALFAESNASPTGWVATGIVAMVVAVKVSPMFGATVTVSAQLKLPVAELVQGEAESEVCEGWVAAKRTPAFDANPVPVAVTGAGRVPVVGERDQVGMAVKAFEEVTGPVPSFAVKVWAVFGEALTVSAQLNAPAELAVHGAAVKTTSPGFDAANVIVELGTAPPPVAVSAAGRGPVMDERVHDEIAEEVSGEFGPASLGAWPEAGSGEPRAGVGG